MIVLYIRDYGREYSIPSWHLGSVEPKRDLKSFCYQIANIAKTGVISALYKWAHFFVLGATKLKYHSRVESF